MQLHGRCCALFAFDVAREIDLARAERVLSESARRMPYRHKSAFSGEGELARPLRFPRPVAPVEVGILTSSSMAQVAVYSAGAIVVSWFFPFQASLGELPAVAAELYGNERLIQRSRQIAEETRTVLRDSVERPLALGRPEDYVVYQVRPPGNLAHEEEPEVLARILRAEEGPLSAEEVAEAFSARVSYAPGELCIVDWNSAWLAGHDQEDERLVLELATVELLELRGLDGELDVGLDRSYRALSTRRRGLAALALRENEIEAIARMQADNAYLHEGVDNAQKLLGDDYLARLYRVAARRFHFDEWDMLVERKLAVLEGTYRKLADQAARRRSEALEWIIIALIAVEIVLYFSPWKTGGA